MDPADDQDLDPAQQAEVCLRVWRAALALLLEDAARYALDARKPFNVPEHVPEQAFDDVCRLGPMLRHLCAHTGDNPRWVRDRFKDAVLDARDGTRKVIRTSKKRGGRRAVPE